MTIVLILLMLMVFLAACCLAWLLLFPVDRDRVVLAMAARLRALGQRCRRLNRGGLVHASSARDATRTALEGGWRLLKYRRWLLLSALSLVCLPAGLVLFAGGKRMLGAYDGESRVANEQVSALLLGEQLVPPPALPPLVFTTLEVARVRPLLDGASRSWQLLDHQFSQRLLLVFKIMKEKNGIDMVLLEGYRSPERQNLLAAAGPNVTNARGFQSYHQFGLAADCAFLRDDKLLISEKDPWTQRAYRLYGEAAEAAGLTWGGRWTMMDFGHTELRVPGVLHR
jgi:peptidoglycan L-alanyl-D-glutamate endopeptidase CwlK